MEQVKNSTEIFGEISIQKLKRIFPSVENFLKVFLGDDLGPDSRAVIQGSQAIFQENYDDYRILFPNDMEAKNAFRIYRFWVEDRMKEIDKEMDKYFNSKENNDITHLEALLALEYLVKAATGNDNFKATNLVRLLYYLRREKPTTTIENSTEYDQFTKLYSKMRTKTGKSVFKNHSKKSGEFLKSIKIENIGDQLIDASKK